MELEGRELRGYLAERLGVEPGLLAVMALGGGVSNDVVLASGGGVRCVAKQSLGRLRVEEEWLSRRDRIHRECDALRAMAGVLPQWAVPRVLFEDRERFVFGMEAAPADALPWKTELLAGEVRAEVAGVCGRLLGAWISESARRPEWRGAFGDLTVFEELRVDPYYRFTAGKHPELREHFAALIDECLQRRVSLVHGDYSPKNLLVSGARVMVIDWEVAHWGDPAFDGGFLTNHLVLKFAAVAAAREELRRAGAEFWRGLREEAGDGYEWLEAASMKHLGCLLLARLDGKSPAEYLKDEELKAKLRGAARELICEPAGTVGEVFERVTKWI
ncbi:MAG: aminoglycoside phosphotransferase family protein [Acidobacteria bacterium]|nr:aminoglycoside phosphotransferase family protein [Acidobacteriota bacterium]